MTKLSEEASNYVAPETKNIADLERVSVNLDIEPRTYKEGTPKVFTVKVVVVDEIEYRVPETVLKQLKAILETRPDTKEIKVNRAGSGMNTSYTTIPL